MLSSHHFLGLPLILFLCPYLTSSWWYPHIRHHFLNTSPYNMISRFCLRKIVIGSMLTSLQISTAPDVFILDSWAKLLQNSNIYKYDVLFLCRACPTRGQSCFRTLISISMMSCFSAGHARLVGKAASELKDL